jgi:hypothetical protein
MKATDFNSYIRKLLKTWLWNSSLQFYFSVSPLIWKARLHARFRADDHSSKGQQEIKMRIKYFRSLIHLRRSYSRLDGCIGVSKYVVDRALNEGYFDRASILIQNGGYQSIQTAKWRSIVNRFVAGNESVKVVTFIGQLIRTRIWTFLEAAIFY